MAHARAVAWSSMARSHMDNKARPPVAIGNGFWRDAGQGMSLPLDHEDVHRHRFQDCVEGSSIQIAERFEAGNGIAPARRPGSRSQGLVGYSCQAGNACGSEVKGDRQRLFVVAVYCMDVDRFVRTGDR